MKKIKILKKLICMILIVISLISSFSNMIFAATSISSAYLEQIRNGRESSKIF